MTKATFTINVQGAKPTGTINITSNSSYDVSTYGTAIVNVPASAVTTGTLPIGSNGTHDVTTYKYVNVQVSSDHPEVNIQDNKEVTISSNAVITPDSGYDAMSKVTIVIGSPSQVIPLTTIGEFCNHSRFSTYFDCRSVVVYTGSADPNPMFTYLKYIGPDGGVFETNQFDSRNYTSSISSSSTNYATGTITESSGTIDGSSYSYLMTHSNYLTLTEKSDSCSWNPVTGRMRLTLTNNDVIKISGGYRAVSSFNPLLAYKKGTTTWLIDSVGGDNQSRIGFYL